MLVQMVGSFGRRYSPTLQRKLEPVHKRTGKGVAYLVEQMCRAYLAPHETPYEGRNNLGAVTVNIPRCAIRAKQKSEQAQMVRLPNKLKTQEDFFWEELDKSVMLAKEALNVRIETCKKIQAKVAPILYLEGAFGLRADSPDEYVFDRFFSNNRSSISLGYIGLYDTCIALFGKGHHESVEAHEFALQVVRRLDEYTTQWKKEENIGYTVYGTP